VTTGERYQIFGATTDTRVADGGTRGVAILGRMEPWGYCINTIRREGARKGRGMRNSDTGEGIAEVGLS
jgi:hypothetical protein